jgi:predicted nucleic acid-binding protein
VNRLVVVDASLAFKWLVQEEHSDKVDALGRLWASQGTRRAAPYFMPVEVANALHRRVTRNEMSVEEAVVLAESLLASGLELHAPPDLYGRALELASQLNQGAVYDAHYLALAEILDCELWTADEKFFRVASPIADNLRWVGELVAPE